MLRPERKVRTSNYLNNIIEQEHRRVKQRIYSKLGFKRLENAAITISGIELMHRIRKREFETSKVVLKRGRSPAALGGSVVEVSSNLVELQPVLYLLFAPEPLSTTLRVCTTT
jgi:DDE domain